LCPVLARQRGAEREREFYIDSLLVRIHFIIVMIRWSGLAPWEWGADLEAEEHVGDLGVPLPRPRLPGRFKNNYFAEM